MTAPAANAMPYVIVCCGDHPDGDALGGAAHRWVARLEAVRLEVQRANVVIAPEGRRCTTVVLSVELTDGRRSTASSLHRDPYVAVSNAFRAVQRLLGRAAAPITRHRGNGRPRVGAASWA